MADEVLDAGMEVGEAVENRRPSDIDLPDDPAAAVAVLKDALAGAQATAAARIEDLQRVAADFENFRKRIGREQNDLVDRASQRLVMAILPVLDSFDAALGDPIQEPSGEALLEGFRSTHRQLFEVLEREGLAPIPAEPGEPFDPDVHEAVAGGAGHDLVVSAQMRRGYTLGDRVLRPSLVAVGPREELDGDHEEVGSE